MRNWEKVENGCSAPIEEEVGRACCRISLQNLLLNVQYHGQLCKGIHKILMQRFELKCPCEITVLRQQNNPPWALMVFRAKTGDLGWKHQPQLLFQICMRRPLRLSPMPQGLGS